MKNIPTSRLLHIWQGLHAKGPKGMNESGLWLEQKKQEKNVDRWREGGEDCGEQRSEEFDSWWRRRQL